MQSNKPSSGSSPNVPQATIKPVFTSFQLFMNAVFICLMSLDFLVSGFGYVYYTENTIQSFVSFESDVMNVKKGVMSGFGIITLLISQLGWIFLLLGVLGFISLFFTGRRSLLLFFMSSVMTITTATKILYIMKNNPHETLSSELEEIIKFEVVQLVVGLLVAFVALIEYRRKDWIAEKED